MPPVLNAQGVSKRYGATPLFENISLAIHAGDRIGLIGPNGAGKSTLLGMLAGEIEPDQGAVSVRRLARIAYVKQVSEFGPQETVRGVIQAALKRGKVPDDEHEQRLRETLGRAGFENLNALANSLSGGWRKRLAITEATVSGPDALLLDEPTNHLDVQGIEWLEGILRAASFASVVVTHDRYFLENVAEEVVELSRAYAEGALRVRGTYSEFLEGREAYLDSQARMQEGLRNRVRTEIEWLRRGPKARATKAKARIDNAHAMIAKLAEADSRMRSANAEIAFDVTGRQTKRLIEMEDVAITLGGREIVRGLNCVLVNGMKLGVAGANGSGKTTILRAMTGELLPDSGAVKRASGLRVVYFSQMRELDPKLTLRRALAPDSDAVVYQERVTHVASYAAKFLFTGDQLNQPVERLSGGERARVLIARLMLQPADVLILDEPTNDLDIPTLEILEESLLDFPGALILVTHDRYMLDRVTNQVLGLDGKGNAALFADYRQWEDWKNAADENIFHGKDEAKQLDLATETKPASAAKKKLSYIEQREFNGLESRIEAADARLEKAKSDITEPSVATDPSALMKALEGLEAAQAEHDTLLERWVELSEKLG